ncbi:MAG: exosortase C-terminal domain/associated protein EpsI [Pyrinomonadaceae bacterium]
MNSSAINPNKLWQPLLTAAALVFLYATVLTKLATDWWMDDNYSHGLLVPFVIGYIVWLEFDKLKTARETPRLWLGGSFILFALLMLLGGTLGAELFTQRISLVLMLVGIVIYFWGANVLKFLVVPVALLLLAIPIPQIIFNKIAFPLQIWASQMAIWGIRLFEVASVRNGNVIEILPRGATQIIALEVVEACSGIRSLMTLMTLALVLAYFTREKNAGKNPFWKNFDFWRAVILMLSAFPIAIFTNAARVTATGVLTYYYGKQATESFWHELSGWLVYVAALILLISLNFGLKKFRIQDSRFRIQDSGFKIQDSGFKIQGVNSGWVLIVILLVGGIFINWFAGRGEAEVSRQPLTEIPIKLGEWRQKGSEIRFDKQTESVLRAGDYMMREYFLPDGRLANLYIGYYASQRTGATYHSPQNCLPGAGWEMKQPDIIEITTPAGKTFKANWFIVENGVYKEILIYWYQGRGRAVASEYKDKVYTVWDSILRRRSDGAMVRVMTSVGSSEADATKAAADLAAQTADKLSEFVPE